MRVAITNLGRLPSVEIDLSKDLLVFTGPNNTSKTYAATTVYGLLRADWLHDLKVDEADHLFRALLQEKGPVAIPWDSSVLAGEVEMAIQRHVDQLAGKGWVREQFASDIATFIQTGIAVHLDAKDRATLRSHAEAGGSFRGAPSNPMLALTDGEALLDETPETWAQVVSPHSLASTLGSLYVYLARRLLGPAVILPAERSAIQLFSRELLLGRSSLASGNPKLQALQRSIPRYPVPIRDCLEITGDLQNLQKRTGPFAHLADELEQQILHGALRASQEGALTFTPEGGAPPLDLHLSSSSVKSLSLLSFYLRHLLDPGDWLIIDEPELNLHPDNQRLVARLLVRLVRAGARVLCSTHSDVIVREINNLIMLSSDSSGALREELGYAPDEALPPERVGAYLFLPTSAEALPVDKTGFAVRTIDREINRMNNTSERIYQSLFGAPEEA